MSLLTLPTRTIFAISTVSWSDTRRFVRSISPEQGQRFVVTTRIAHPTLGSDFNFRQLTSSYARYFALPWKSSGGAPLHKRTALEPAIQRIERGEAEVLVVAYFTRLVRSLGARYRRGAKRIEV